MSPLLIVEEKEFSALGSLSDYNENRPTCQSLLGKELVKEKLLVFQTTEIWGLFVSAV